MKPRLGALMLLVSMLLLVGLIPAVAGAQTPAPQRGTTLTEAQRRELAAAHRAAQQPDAPPPAPERGPVDTLRLERHPEEQERLGRASAESAASSAPEAPVPPAPDAMPSAYPDPEPGVAVVRASVDDLGQDANSDSYDPVISDDGRYVAFESFADNLVPNDWNEAWDIFLRDTYESTIERISVSNDGDEGNSDSYDPSISADGRYVVFSSYASNLVDDDVNGNGSDIFLYDRQSGDISLISRHSDGTQGNWDSYEPVISADGNFVAYYSYADNLADDDQNIWFSDIFLYNVATEETSLISLHSDGTGGNDYSYSPAISADGSYVAFVSHATNLVDDDVNGWTSDIFIHEVSTGVTSLVSRDSAGVQGNNSSYSASISGDGQVIAFHSFADNLVADDANGQIPDVFVHDLMTEDTVMASRHSDGTPGNWESYDPVLSGNGRYVTFYSFADNLLDMDNNGSYSDVFVHDLQTNETTLVSKSVYGEQGYGSSGSPAINNDGSIIAFDSSFYSLASSYRTWYFWDIYVRFTGLTDTYSISGRVVDENGDGAWSVGVRDISGAGSTTDNDGYYIIEGLLPGNHGVWAWDINFSILFPEEPIAVTLPPNAEDIDIEGTGNDSNAYGYTSIADAYVDEAKKTKNYGSQPVLRVKNAAKDFNSYMKFEVTDLPSCAHVTFSHIELFAPDGGSGEGEMFETGNDWTETGINWNNAPAPGGVLDWWYPLGNNSYAWLFAGVYGNDTYSYGLRSYSNKLVQFQSREGSNAPTLYVDWRPEPERMLDAQFNMEYSSDVAPATIRFADTTTGCATEYEWDFGDGNTSTEQSPTHTYTEPGVYSVVLTVTNSKGVDKKTQWIEINEPVDITYLSLAKKATVAGLVIEPADIVRYDKDANTWTMVYDGSVRGTKANISSFAWSGDDLLLVFAGKQVITGLGTATQYDVVRFSPNNPGVFPLGGGTFYWEWRGGENGLTTGKEKIDALTRPQGYNYMLLSTSGAASLPNGITAADEDLVVWDTWSWQWGDWLPFDGSPIPGMAAKNLIGAWYDDVAYDYYFVLNGKFDLDGVKGNDSNIVRLAYDDNLGYYAPSLADWLAPGVVFKGKIDAIEMARE